MTLNTRILALVDPSQKKQQALARARFNAERRDEKPLLTVFMAVDREVHKQLKTPPILFRDAKWVSDTLSRLTDVGLEHELCIGWDKNWAEAVLGEIKRSKPDQVLVPIYEDEDGNRIVTDETWKLLRASKVTVSLIHPRKDDREERNVILAAIKSQDPVFDERTKRTIAQAKALAKIYGAEVHYVNAYQDSAKFPDRTKIMKMTCVSNSNVHVIAGPISEVLPKVSRKVKADIVMIAPLRKQGLIGTLRGSTISRIIDNIQGDVMAVF